MKLLALLTLVVLCGCAAFRETVPTTRITGSVGGVPWTIEAPKQVQAELFDAQLFFGTNRVSIRIRGLKSVNDPQVIDKAAAGRVAEINAWSDMVDKGIERGVKAFAPVP